jgi:hypothetical protein
MKIAIQYSGYLRFIQDTYPLIKTYFTSNQHIEFYIFVHTWDESLLEDIEYMKNIIKPSRYYIDKQSHFERHPYQLINCDTTHEEYKNSNERFNWNNIHPNDQKLFFEKPDIKNNFSFNKELEVIKFDYYSQYPYNNLCMFYSMNQVSILTNSFAQEHNIVFDFIVRIRSDIQLSNTIHIDNLDKDKMYVFEASPHPGEQGKYTINDHFAISNHNNMKIYNDLFIYLPCYYYIMKLDWIPEILIGFHLQYNNILIEKIPRFYTLLRYNDHVNCKRSRK